MNRCIVVTVVLSVFYALFCELPENPRNIDNAGIERETLTALPAKVPVNSVFPCTLLVKYPEFVDSFAVYTTVNNGGRTKVAGAAIEGDTVVLFTLHLAEPALYAVSLLVYKADRIDSAAVAVVVFSTTPLVTAGKTRIAAPVDTAATLRFAVSDPDSNLLEYTLMQGTAIIDKKQFLAGERAAAEIRKDLPAGFLKALHDTLSRFSAVVMDADSQMSAAALCTLIVRDTIRPRITILSPHNDSVRTVAKLPDTIRAIISDNWDVDSVKYGGLRVAMVSGDTMQVIIVKLDSGKTVDTLEAWDPAGNHTRVGIALRYSGPKVYPPKITPFYQTVNEGGRFDTVFLDSKVTITDSSATYGKDSLRWSMVVDSLGPDMTIRLDTVVRILTIAGPSGELNRDRMTTVSLTVTDPAGLSASVHGITFIMVEKDDPPRITLAGQGKIFKSSFDTLMLDTCGFDPEKNTQLVWNITRGKWLYPEFLKVTRCTGLILGKTASKQPVCREVLTGKVVIRSDSVAVAALPSTQDVLDTLLFSLKSIGAGDTVEVFKKVPFSWGRLKIYIPIEIPQFVKP